jgi:NAD(P)-dependent dehydrogenase (short-subunit alcohol dehydrogenase family)
MSTTKQIALVTGASSGIGRTSAIALIKAGWRVVLSGRRREELQVTEEMGREVLRDLGREEEASDERLVLVVVGDVSVESNVREMFEQVQEVYGESGEASVVVLTNRVEIPRSPRPTIQRMPLFFLPLPPLTRPLQNAGISGKSIPIEDLEIQDYLAVMNINVTAAVICTQYATRMMKAQEPQGGRIINNGR